MPRKKIQEDKKKIKTGVTINSDVVELMDELIEDIGNTNRSRYIEKLIREDLEKRGKNIEKDF
jgi:metal-responsive CopG/Arc/MetJ family transcriptional regulator